MAHIEVTARGCTLNDEISTHAKREAEIVTGEWEGIESIGVAIEATGALARGARYWVRLTIVTVEELILVSAPSAADASSDACLDGVRLGLAQAFREARRRLCRTRSVRPAAAAAE
ncbi:MAG: hypothetical protein U0414_22465 [Polyangiaceae bacterium]